MSDKRNRSTGCAVCGVNVTSVCGQCYATQKAENEQLQKWRANLHAEVLQYQQDFQDKDAEIERLRAQVAAALDLLTEKPSDGESLADCDRAAWDAAVLLREALARPKRA